MSAAYITLVGLAAALPWMVAFVFAGRKLQEQALELGQQDATIRDLQARLTAATTTDHPTADQRPMSLAI